MKIRTSRNRLENRKKEGNCQNTGSMLENLPKIFSPAGNPTPVSRVTGGDTHHYTTEDSVMIEVKILQTAQLSTFSFSVFRACFVSFVVGLYEDFFWRPRDSIKKKNGTSNKNCSLKFLNLERAKMFTTQISCNLTSQMNTTRVVITTKYSMTQSCFEALALLTAKPWIPRFI